MGLSLVTWTVVETFLNMISQYKVMKFLVFGIISSSLLSELQVMIPKVNHNGVCICIVYPMFRGVNSG